MLSIAPSYWVNHVYWFASVKKFIRELGSFLAIALLLQTNEILGVNLLGSSNLITFNVWKNDPKTLLWCNKTAWKQLWTPFVGIIMVIFLSVFKIYFNLFTSIFKILKQIFSWCSWYLTATLSLTLKKMLGGRCPILWVLVIQ